MEKIKFRDLKPEELEVRVGTVIKDKQTGKTTSFVPLVYKTARADANVLDETFGIFGWKCSYYQVKNTMVCSISIWDKEKGQWINKDNGGDDDFQSEQIKAELSDSMKRAGFTLGIARKLYSLSKHSLFINIDEENTTSSRYVVKEIEYDDTSVTKIVIINKKTRKVVCESPKQFSKTTDKVAVSSQKEPKKPISDISMEQHENDCGYINTYLESLEEKRREGFVKWICQFQQVNSLDELRSNVDKCHAVAEWLRKKGI